MALTNPLKPSVVVPVNAKGFEGTPQEDHHRERSAGSLIG